MKNLKYKSFFILPLVLLLIVSSCDYTDIPNEIKATETDYTDHLTNQANEVIVPTMVNYSEKMRSFKTSVEVFASSMTDANLLSLRSAYNKAYIAYQAVAVHDYYATSNLNLVNTTNLYPVDTSILENLIANESYNFSTEAQKRANGFPAIDFMLYGTDNVITYFKKNSKKIAFLKALVTDMDNKAKTLLTQWSGNLKENFIENGGVALGSSISVQLNQSIAYVENHIREVKVGLPIGRTGPNDTPIEADPTKIEAYYQSQYEGNEGFTLSLVKAAVEEVEDIYLGSTSLNKNKSGYEDLLIKKEKSGIDADIKEQFGIIYTIIENRTSISGDGELYEAVQGIVSLYKSDLFPVLNVQDADGLNDGD